MSGELPSTPQSPEVQKPLALRERLAKTLEAEKAGSPKIQAISDTAALSLATLGRELATTDRTRDAYRLKVAAIEETIRIRSFGPEATFYNSAKKEAVDIQG